MVVIYWPVSIYQFCEVITYHPFRPDRYHENATVYVDLHWRWSHAPGDVAQLRVQVAVLD